MRRGSVFRRCGCRDQGTGDGEAASCPELGSGQHGSWHFSVDLPSGRGERRVRRGGFATRAAAVAALEAVSGPGPVKAAGVTTGQWLDSRVSLLDSTRRGYAGLVGPVPWRHPAG
jgi:hypothetical protein